MVQAVRLSLPFSVRFCRTLLIWIQYVDICEFENVHEFGAIVGGDRLRESESSKLSTDHHLQGRRQFNNEDVLNCQLFIFSFSCTHFYYLL